MLELNDPTLLKQAILVGGEWIANTGHGFIDVTNPATGALVGRVPKATRPMTVAAIENASQALPAWSARPAAERSRIIRRWHDLIVEHVDDLARILTAEQGKPFAEARGEILYGAAFFEWYAEDAKRLYGEVLQAPAASRRMLVLRQPIGVCAAITPWNFPMAMIPRKAAPALAAGCTMVLKPASATPFSALALGELAQRAGVPAGVFSIVAGAAAEVGDELATHSLIRKLTFTGSTEVGRSLMEKASGTIKKVAMELGGNAPLIVFDDADVDVAVAGTIASKFRNMGQTCVCANRIYVQAGIHDRFVAALCDAVAALKVGDGMAADTQQGPLIDDHAVAKVEEHIEDALRQGARIAVGGKRHALGRTFFEPTVLTGVTQAMKVSREETFGPVAPIFRFDTEAEAIAAANDTEFGLASYFFTRDNARVWRVSEALETGIVGVNTGATSFEGAPFGGIKASGIGREGSTHGIEEFTELKYVCIAEIC
ncbi:NAD-dependent succinate-semialdehyde dehydrogenase [Paraburkholderia caballeronis]|uniref:NAD-dependent succinate-semialdehyde dehydrogenase n=1 Tax=Paraburkholderia caballeronis TaxID=416943 RepID=UPI001064B5D0|nr:NAD-dependent succinate-semialdehyde dehydrogenase [Paraburkholderia caballeronis]TDV15684.1 succinate semialdehyde dehydrogenase [Paraburkholderia caballeronis]TDV17939.1 succinate semialdehyde dehydrogenase [Paraburkholderia caballeronis]TDV26447.1 succinate semialdehyde dehydrogenase [Paraburkholderia caballeronis]